MQNYAKYPLRRNTPKTSHQPGAVEKWVLAVVTALFIPLTLPAQVVNTNNENLHFGLSFGGGLTHTFTPHTPWDFSTPASQVSVSGGAYFQIDFAKRFFTHIEVHIADRKLSGDGVSADSLRGDFNLKKAYTNISAPLGLGVWFWKKDSPFNISLTACAVVGLPQESSGSEVSVNHQNIDKNVYYVNIGAMLNLRFKYKFMFLDFRYEFTGTPVFKYKEQPFRTGTFGFMLGFQIF